MKDDIRLAVYNRDGHICQDCGHEGKPGSGRDDIQLHHFIPVRAGGADTLANLTTLCHTCHKKAERESTRKYPKPSSPNPVTLRVDEILAERNINISQLAEMMDVNYRTAHLLATGRTRRLDLNTINIVCNALGIEPSELFKRPPKRRKRARKRTEAQS